MSQQDQIVAHFFALPDSEQEVVFRSCLCLLEPRYQQQVLDLLTKPFPFGLAQRGEGAAALCPGVDTMPAANYQATRAGASPEATPGAGRLGNNADFALLRVESPQVAIAARTRRRRKLRDTFPPGAALTPDEVCARLGISRVTLQREIAAERFPAPIRIGHQRRWRLADVDRYLSQLGDMSPYLRNGGRSDYHQRHGSELRANNADAEMVALIRRTISERGGVAR